VQELGIAFLGGATFSAMIGYFVHRIAVKARVEEYMKNCDYTACEKYCEVDRVNRNLNKEYVQIERELKAAIADSINVRRSRNKDIGELNNLSR
jgi:hypothetical protein